MVFELLAEQVQTVLSKHAASYRPKCLDSAIFSRSPLWRSFIAQKEALPTKASFTNQSNCLFESIPSLQMVVIRIHFRQPDAPETKGDTVDQLGPQSDQLG